MNPAENAAQRPAPVRRIFRSLKSIRFAVILMALIAVACLVGTLVAQTPYNADEAIFHYGHTLGLLVGLLGLNHLYSAWWFVGLLFLLALSIATCSFSGLRLSFRKICTLIAHASILLIVAGAILRALAAVDGTLVLEKDQPAETMQVDAAIRVDYTYKAGSAEKSVKNERHILPAAGTVLLDNAHVVPESFVVRDATNGKTFQAGADYEVVQNEEQAGIVSFPNGRIGARPLGVQMRLDDFVIQRNDDGLEALEVKLDAAGPSRSFSVEVGKVIPLRPDGTSLEVLRRLPHLMVGENNQIYSASDEPVNPALQVRLTGPGGEPKPRWVYAKHPEFSGHGEGPSAIELTYVMDPGTVKAYESHVTVLDASGREVRKAVILVNSPLKVGRYTFYQYKGNAGPAASSTLEVASDPGVPLVFAGFILLPIGIALTIYGRPLLSRAGAKARP